MVTPFGKMLPASPSPSVRCRPRPLAAAVVTATAAAAAAAAATAVRSVVDSGSAAGTAAAAAAALLAATLAAVAAAVGWPRLATNTLHLHGSVLPTVSGGGRSPLRSAIGDFVAARRAGRLCHLYLRWQASVGAGRNFQAFYFGTRVVTLVCAQDVRHLLERVDPPRNVAALRHFGTPISPRTLLLLGNGAGEHAAMRRLLAPYLEGPPATAAVLGMLNRELSPGKGGWGGGAPVDDTRSGQGVVSPPGVWTARFDAWAAQGTALDIADVLMDLTLGVIHALIFTSGWAHEEDCAKAKSTLQDYFTLQYLALVPAPAVTAPGPLRTLRDGGAWWVAYVTAAEARRRARRGVASPPVDLFDIFLADLEKPGGAFGGDWRRMAADVMALMSAGYDTTVRRVAAGGPSVQREWPMEKGTEGGRFGFLCAKRAQPRTRARRARRVTYASTIRTGAGWMGVSGWRKAPAHERFPS